MFDKINNLLNINMPFGLKIPPPPQVPVIKLPKLSSLLAAAVPFVSLPILSVVAKLSFVKGFLTAALSPFQQKLKALTSVGSAQSLTDKARSFFIDNVLKSVTGFIKNQVSGLVNAALGSATAAVGAVKGAVQGAITAIKGVNQLFINSFNAAKAVFAKQNKNVSSLVDKEIDLATENDVVNYEVSAIQADITKAAKKNINNLTNNELKELSENPEKKEQYVNSVTDSVVKDSSNSISNTLKTNYPEQVKTVDKLETLSTKIEYDTVYEMPVSYLQKATRLQLLQSLQSSLSDGMNYYSSKKYPELKAARLAEKARVESDISSDPGTIKYIYVKKDEFIILR